LNKNEFSIDQNSANLAAKVIVLIKYKLRYY